jgi:hypothetical protein
LYYPVAVHKFVLEICCFSDKKMTEEEVVCEILEVKTELERNPSEAQIEKFDHASDYNEVKDETRQVLKRRKTSNIREIQEIEVLNVENVTRLSSIIMA